VSEEEESEELIVPFFYGETEITIKKKNIYCLN
jgi:hypothetical protein